MNKEELLEMIDSTINENGARMITGKALNLALTEIVNAMGSGAGAGGIKIYITRLPMQPIQAVTYEIPECCYEHNREVYNKFHEAWLAVEEIEGVVYLDYSHFDRWDGLPENSYYFETAQSWGIDEHGNFGFMSQDGRRFFLHSDGDIYDYPEKAID